ncbi:MAG TPA: tyrosine-type recombinase/integrase [Gammaproteobacteria bacterium]|nr:tyrosine-type recombinase/integrase [Gammaproteobacteria bacterium]
MPLTDVLVRNARPTDKPIRLFDGGGLYLEVSPTGGKWWRLKYRFGGKEKRLSVGVYPVVSLKEARAKRDELKRQLAAGIDPSMTRKTQKAARITAGENTFEALAREWHAQRAKSLEQSTLDGIMARMERHLFPRLRGRPIAEIEAPELLKVLQRAEEQELGETPRRLRQYCGQIFRYAIATGRAKRDPAADLRGALKPHKVQHHAAVTAPKAVGALLRAIEGFRGSPTTKAALRLAPLVFVRPGELRRAEWTEFDLKGRVWRIPAERMKMREAHLVPLSRQAVAILEELHELTGPDGTSRIRRYLFPSARTRERPISENTLNAALRRLGYASDEMTSHGFRSMASTLLNEQGWHRDAIERQLAHAERDGVRAAYNRAEHLPERKKMMQAWADYLDALRDGADVIPIAKKA